MNIEDKQKRVETAVATVNKLRQEAEDTEDPIKMLIFFMMTTVIQGLLDVIEDDHPDLFPPEDGALTDQDVA